MPFTDAQIRSLEQKLRAPGANKNLNADEKAIIKAVFRAARAPARLAIPAAIPAAAQAAAQAATQAAAGVAAGEELFTNLCEQLDGSYDPNDNTPVQIQMYGRIHPTPPG